jgi:hypothetical protein
MAGDWIKMRTALANDPAVIAIALDLDKSEFEVVGMLHHLWSWADSQSQDGHVKRVTEKWIDRYVHHAGFAKSMSGAGWLVIEESGITFPNFERHNGESAKKRAEAAERQRISRENKRLGIVTDSSQDTCDKSVTREEKRREEKNKDQEHCAELEKTTLVGAQFLIDQGCDPQHAKDWIAVRQTKKAKLTITSWSALVREAVKANITPAYAVQIAAENAWQSFKASYDWRATHGTNTAGRGQGKASLTDQVREHNEQQERLRQLASEPIWPSGSADGQLFEADRKSLAHDD